MRLLLVVFICCAASRVLATEVARCGETTISLEEIDAATGGKAASLRDRLRAQMREATLEWVDSRLEVGTEAIERSSVSDEEIEAFREARAADFGGEDAPGRGALAPGVQRQAIRYYLERDQLASRREAARARRRASHEVEIRLPERLDAVLPSHRALGRLDGAVIAAGEVERLAALSLYRLRGELHRERRRAFDARLESCLLGRLAARRGSSVEALERSFSEAVRVSDSEVDAFIAGKQAAGRPALSRDRARPYLVFQRAYAARAAALADERDRTPVSLVLRAPVAPRFAPEVPDGAPSLGAANGPLIVVFSNYRCRVCRATHEELDRLLARTPGARLVLRDFLPSWDPSARRAAAIARCGSDQNLLAPLRRLLLERDPPAPGTPWLDEAVRRELSSRLGLKLERFDRCLESPETEAMIESDSAAARTLGFTEAPAFVAAGRPLSGMQSAEGLEKALHEGPE